MKTGDVIQVIKYRNNEDTSIKIGIVESIRDTHSNPPTLETYKRYVITRSKNLITLRGDNGLYRSYYDKFLISKPVSKFKRLLLKLRGKI